MVDAYKDFGTLSTIFWFHPGNPGRHIPTLPLWDMFVEIDTEMEKLEMDKDIPYLSTKASLEECQRSSVNFLNMPYINDCTYLSQ